MLLLNLYKCKLKTFNEMTPDEYMKDVSNALIAQLEDSLLNLEETTEDYFKLSMLVGKIIGLVNQIRYIREDLSDYYEEKSKNNS